MFTRCALVVALMSLLLGVPTSSAKPPVRNAPALDFEATDLQGQSFKGTSLHGKIVLLDFWATWCLPCIKAIPTLNELDQKLRDKGFEVVGVAMHSGTREEVTSFVKERGMNYTVVMGNDDLVEKFEVIGYPTYVLIDRDGQVHKKYFGEVEGFSKEIHAQISRLAQ